MMNAGVRCGWFAPATLLLLTSSFASTLGQPDVQKIVQLSVTDLQADWQQMPNFESVERDEDTKGGKITSETYEAMMIDGSPYNRLVARDGLALSSEEAARQTKRLEEENARRAKESPQERAARIAKYQKDRNRAFVLMRNMTEAFDFQLKGEETVEGHNVYVLRAVPRPDYQPASHETRMLTGMQGTLWIDKETNRWVRVEAEVIEPVWFGWFLAKVDPGTQFLLEQTPLPSGIWLPKHFRVRVKASLLWLHKDYAHDETYQDYRPISGPTAKPPTVTNKVNSN